MAQDITLMGASFSDVPGVLLPKTGGGQALFSDASVTTAVASDVATGKTFLLADGTPAVGTNSGGGGGETWSWMGRNPTLVASWNGDAALADTGFATWTPSTTATTIIASAKAGEFEANMADYDYVIYNKFSIAFVYKAGTTLKVTPYSESTTGAIALIRVPSSGTSFSTKEKFTWTKSLIPGTQANPLLYYYDNGGAILANCSSTAYGIYSAKVATSTITFSGALGDTKTVSVYLPNVLARCNSSYFATARAADVDQEATIARRTIEVWRVDVDTSPVGFVWHDGVTLLGDPYNQ